MSDTLKLVLQCTLYVVCAIILMCLITWPIATIIFLIKVYLYTMVFGVVVLAIHMSDRRK